MTGLYIPPLKERRTRFRVELIRAINMAHLRPEVIQAIARDVFSTYSQKLCVRKSKDQ